MVDEEYLDLPHRAGARASASASTAHGVPYLRPAGGHAIYLDAKSMLPHIPPSGFPGVSFTAALYLEAGIRACEIGSLMFEHADPDSGELVSPEMELVRLAIPRRVYSHTQLDYVADACARVRDLGPRLQPLEIVWQPAGAAALPVPLAALRRRAVDRHLRGDLRRGLPVTVDSRPTGPWRSLLAAGGRRPSSDWNWPRLRPVSN